MKSQQQCRPKDIEIIRNVGDFETYWTLEIDKKLTKKQVEKLAKGILIIDI